MAVIEQRYAQALADLVAQGVVPAGQMRRELAELTQVIESSRPLRTVLASPAVAWDKKRALLDAVADRVGVSRIARNFLIVAAQRGRVGRLAGMDLAFEQLLLEREGIVKAEVASARQLNARERAAIEAELARQLGRKLQTRYVTDAALVGGFVARVGDQVYDGSIRGRLGRLRQALLTA
ncbi:MAG TPA: ATP synthase F1 subunit delta [Terriglobales bacterium]|nr:ATP synthase F1 subunit delta [Terriglobales bacterium]